MRKVPEEESRFRGLLESAPDAMIIVSADGRIRLVNQQTEKLFLYPREELLGQLLEMLIPEGLRGGHSAHRAGYVRDPRPRPMGAGLALKGRRKDGSEFPAEISLAPMWTDDGQLVTAAVRDVTARKEIELALLAANRELEAFSYSVAHDLRAPLRGISGFAQVLLEEYADKLDDEGRDCVREIHDNALQMGALIDALLSLSRVSRSELKLERVDLSTLARAVAARLAAAEPAREVELIVAPGLEAPLDPSLANALLENLLGNAWKFTARGPFPRVEVGALEGPVFFVRDNGAGFDMAYAQRLFAPFQRLHSAGEFAGTGIGLATAQRIVHRHGGRIWAEGAIGKGAAFFFELGERG